MSNQLAIPLKKTIDVSLKDAIREFFLSHFTHTHPDAFQWDMARWQELRKMSSGGSVHVERIDTILEYHAQLVFILTKLPHDVGVEISYSSAFFNSSTYIPLHNLQYERISVLFNLAALHSHLAFSENRSHAEGIKRAIMFYQRAAGTLSYIKNSALPVFVQSLSNQEQPLEYTQSSFKALEYIMLAQGQECAWQRAITDNLKNGLIAKISARVSSLYGLALQEIKESSPNIRNAFPTEWLIHIEVKYLHFEAAAHFRKSLEDSEVNRYGHELARLSAAHLKAKTGYDLARRNLAARPVIDDIKSLLDMVQKNIIRAERDNDLIYHQDVPAISALPIIQEVSLAQSIILPGLLDPKGVLGEKELIFGGLLGWGASTAMDIYRDRVQNYLKDEVYSCVTELDTNAAQQLQSLKLPASLDALDKPIGLPQSLLRKAEEVRLEDGPARIEKCFESTEMLVERIQTVLNEAMDLLDQEAAEDEEIQKRLLESRVVNSRTPSHVANQDYVAKERRYREILSQAAQSDTQVREKWDEWEANIVRLTWKEEDLDNWVPSSTISKPGHQRTSTETQKHARALHVLMEELDNLQRSRANMVQRARRLAEADDIKPRIMREASAIESWVEVNPAMFEDTLDQEMNKYEKFKESLEENAVRQRELLDLIKSRNQSLLDFRQVDQSVKDRALALQSLDLAYHKYREIQRNFDEGLKFYNDLANIVTEFRERCKEFMGSRRTEITDLSQSFQSMALDNDGRNHEHTYIHGSSSAHDSTGSKKPSSNINSTLPPLDSSDWESVQLPSPAPMPVRKSVNITSQRKHNK